MQLREWSRSADGAHPAAQGSLGPCACPHAEHYFAAEPNGRCGGKRSYRNELAAVRLTSESSLPLVQLRARTSDLAYCIIIRSSIEALLTRDSRCNLQTLEDMHRMWLLVASFRDAGLTHPALGKLLPLA
jgi:hypothetical protein